MIVVYEPFSTNLNHIPVNSEFLNIIGEKFPDKKIAFYGEAKHIENVMANVNHGNIVSQDIRIIEPMISKVKALINEWRNVLFLSKTYKNKMELLIILNSHPHTMYYVKRYIPENVPVIFILHGNIEELKRRKYFYQLGFWVKPAFRYKKNRKNMKYIVLGDSIKSNLLTYVGYIRNNLVAVPHPYSLYEVPTKCISETSAITMGMIGSFSTGKRSELIFELEDRLKKRNVNNIKFLLVGSGDKNMFPVGTSVKFFGNGNNKLSEEDFNHGIEKLDYILFFWSRNSYKMTASGAVCDAIVHNKPIISIRNDYLTWVFSEVGDLGFLCENMDEIEDVVLGIAKGEFITKLNEISENFDRAKKFFSRDNVARIMDEKNVWMIH